MSKQVIVIRKDLKMRKGKMIAQGAHASLKAFMGFFRAYDYVVDWWEGSQTKIVVGVNSEEELLDIRHKAQDIDIPCSLIQDEGRTEFGGVPTYTAVAVGPAPSDLIDPITGHLKLL